MVPAPRLLPYLSDLHAGWLAADPASRWREVEGTLVFLDISGFTGMAERLARRGKVGAEELTGILNMVFGELLEVSAGLGGDCLKFGGDALLLLLTGDGHAARAREVAGRVTDAMKKFRQFRSGVGTIRLALTGGVHSGLVHFVLAGGIHRDLLVVGPAVSETLRREAAATRGRIAVSPAVMAARTAGHPEEASWGSSEAAASVGLSPALASYLTGEAHDGEHRLAAIGFLKFSGTDDLLESGGPELLSAALDELLCAAQSAAAEHGVTILGSDVDENGGKLILSAGVPSATPDDGDRLLHALRGIVEVPAGPLTVRAGAHWGRVFAVDLGAEKRRTFTVIGDTVNLAARIMSHAPAGRVLASRQLLDRVHTNFHVFLLEPFTVKGKTAAVEAGVIGDAVGLLPEAELEDVPLVGRRLELGTIQEALARAASGHGSVVEVVGEAGIGKSKLVASAVARSELPLVLVRGGRYSRATPYYSLRNPLLQLLELEDPTHAHLEMVVRRIAPELDPWLPLIGSLLGIEVPDTPETARLDVAFRASKLRSVGAELLTRLLDTALWVVEDAHWLDVASCELLSELIDLTGRRPWVFVVTRRPVEEGLSLGDRASRRLQLEPLSDEDAASMLTTSLGSASSQLVRGSVKQLVERAGGNPLFLRELLRAATTQAVEDLPETVEAVVASMIDTLPPDDRFLLRRAAVLGARFPLAILASVLDVDGDQLAGRLQPLGHFLQEDAGSVTFSHVLLRDVAYEGLPYKSRRQLHARTGSAWEVQAGSRVEEVAELLSVHFHAAGDNSRSWRYSLMAAGRAERAAAPVEAAAFYRRCLEAARQLPEVSVKEEARIAERLGDMAIRAGRYHESRDAYTTARRLAEDRVALARLHRKAGATWGEEGRPADCIRACRRGIKALNGSAPDPQADKERAKLLAQEGMILLRQGRHAEARSLLEQSVALARGAEAAGNRTALARAYRYLDWLHIELGEEPPEPYARLALGLYESLGDHMGVSQSLNNMGIAAYYRGDWEDSVGLYERCRQAAAQAGSGLTEALALNNIAEIRSDQGRLAEAEDLLHTALETWRGAGHLFEGMTVGNLARAAARAGRFERASDLYGSALAVLERNGEVALAAETTARQAELCMLAGDPGRALKTVDEVSRMTRRQLLPTTWTLLDRVAGYALAQESRLRPGWERLTKSIIRSSESRDAFGAALGLEGLARLADLRGDRAATRTFALDALELFTRLGVVRTPVVPLIPCLTFV